MSRFVRLYPATWRARYEVELRDTLSSRPLTVRDRWDLVRGALDAWVHPELVEPVAGELALAGHGSFEAHHRADMPWIPFLGVLAATSLAMAALQVLIRPHGLWGEQHPQSVLLTVATLALGTVFWLQRAAPLTRLGGIAMIAITLLLVGHGWDGDHLTPAIGLGVGGAIAGLGGSVHARPGRLTGLALMGLGVSLATVVQMGAVRGTAVVLLGYAFVALRMAAPGLWSRRVMALGGAAAGVLLAGCVMTALAWADPWSAHDGYALGCHVDPATCQRVADTMAPAIRSHFPSGRVLAIEVRADGMVWACWRDTAEGIAGECRMGRPEGWPSGPLGSL